MFREVAEADADARCRCRCGFSIKLAHHAAGVGRGVSKTRRECEVGGDGMDWDEMEALDLASRCLSLLIEAGG